MASIAADLAAPEGIPARPARPQSAVSHGVGLAGLAGLFSFILAAHFLQLPRLWVQFATPYGLSWQWIAMLCVLACGIPMVLWSVFVDKVHRNPSTGIDWDAPPRPFSETFELSLAKLAGLWATWAILAFIYTLCRFYWSGNYLFAMEAFAVAAVPMFVLSVPYVLWIDTRLKNPRDGAWAFGSWLMGDDRADRSAIADHARSWAVKGFYTAFMVSIVPGNFDNVVGRSWSEAMATPVAMTGFLINFMFLIDVAMATVGYVLTMKPLDAHIRSATPYMAGWVSALICYPPFILMGGNGPLDYHPGTREWDYWFAAHPALLTIWGAALVVLTGIYAWATVAFGIRFSNLTHRGILTHGPYAIVKHPAYWSKNIFWWLATLPFFHVSGSLSEGLRNTIILGLVSGVYWWRARTEEKHLGNDPDYRAYAAWMKAHGPFARLKSACLRKFG